MKAQQGCITREGLMREKGQKNEKNENLNDAGLGRDSWTGTSRPAGHGGSDCGQRDVRRL